MGQEFQGGAVLGKAAYKRREAEFPGRNRGRALLLPVLLTGLAVLILGYDPAQAAGVTDPAKILSPASLPLQPAGVPFQDPVFGTTLRRVSDTSGSGGFETQIYSQLQAFSADNVYLLLSSDSDYLVRRVSDLSKVSGLDTAMWNDPRWQPALAHTIVHYDGNDDTVVRVQYTDVNTLTTTTEFTFPAQYEYIRVNQSFDELSHDGRWMAGMLTRSDGESVIFTLDLQSRKLGAEIPVSPLFSGPCRPDPEWGAFEPDWIGVSPLGNYLMVQWARDGVERCSGLESFDIETGSFIGRVYDGHQHGDLGVDTDGVSEFFMTSEISSPLDPDRPAFAIRALPGTATASTPNFLLTIDWADDGHISCQGPHGACLITHGGWPGDGWTPFERELFLLHTDSTVERLVHHRSSSCGYWVQPRATISRDGRFVVFASDWGQQTGRDSCTRWGTDLGAGDPYLIDLEAEGARQPIPDIRANGADRLLRVRQTEEVTISIGLDPGTYAGTSADWWLVALSGREQLVVPLGRQPLQSLVQTPLFTRTLAAGAYAFMLVLDDKPDSKLDITWYDYVVVGSSR